MLLVLVLNGWVGALIMLGIVLAVQQIEGNVLQPILQSQAMGLHAAIVLLAVALGGTIFGIVGAFLAVPVAAVVAVWFRYWAEMVSLRTGEITADDIQISTAQSESLDSREAFLAVRKRMASMAKLQKPGQKATLGSTKVPLDDAAPKDSD